MQWGHWSVPAQERGLARAPQPRTSHYLKKGRGQCDCTKTKDTVQYLHKKRGVGYDKARITGCIATCTILQAEAIIKMRLFKESCFVSRYCGLNVMG